MRTRWMTVMAVGVVAIAVGIGTGAIMWAGDAHGTAGGDHAGMSMDASTVSGSGRLGEQAFLQAMTPHHEAAVEMAQMALEKAAHEPVRRLARRIIGTQSREIAEMRSWYRVWYGRPMPDDATMDHMDMAALESASGPDFDRAFLRAMLAHHAGGIVMADEVLQDSPRGEIQRLADNVITAQAREVGQMQQWRETWYPPTG